MWNYIIVKSKTTRHKQEVAGPFRQYRRNQSNNVSWFPSSQKYLKRKAGNHTLKPTNVSIKQIPRYKERESPVMHIEQVSKNIGEHG